MGVVQAESDREIRCEAAVVWSRVGYNGISRENFESFQVQPIARRTGPRDRERNQATADTQRLRPGRSV